MAFTDRNVKIAIEAWGTFKAVTQHNVVCGDLLNFAESSSTRAVRLADETLNRRARAVAIEPGSAGEEIVCALGAKLMAPISLSLAGETSATYFAASGDSLGTMIYLGDSGKPSSSAGSTAIQQVGWTLARDMIILNPGEATPVDAGAFSTFQYSVVPSNAEARLLAVSRLLVSGGYPLQVCAGVSSDEEAINAAISA